MHAKGRPYQLIHMIIFILEKYWSGGRRTCRTGSDAHVEGFPLLAVQAAEPLYRPAMHGEMVFYGRSFLSIIVARTERWPIRVYPGGRSDLPHLVAPLGYISLRRQKV